MRPKWKLLASGGLALLLVATGVGAFLLERPTRLSVAVSESDPADFALIDAASKLVKFGKRAVRLRLVPVADARAAATAVDKGRAGGGADLAVVRTDVAVPLKGQTVVILHRDAAVFVAPASVDIDTIAALRGHTIGIVHAGTGNRRLLDAALAQNDVDPGDVRVEDLAPGAVADAVRAKRVDAVLAVAPVASPELFDIVKAVGDAGGGAAKFLSVDQAAAIAQRSPGYESFEVVAGSFGGATPRPADDLTTLAVTYRLVANEDFNADAIADVTRFILNERDQLAAVAPLARNIEAPSTDKGALHPVHAGAAAFIDDEEETFFDKYSDFIYIGAMLIGVLASGVTAVMSRIGTRHTQAMDAAVDRLIDLLAEVRAAPSGAMLDRLQSEADGILASVLDAGAPQDEKRFAAFGLTLSQLHAAVADRRRVLDTGTVGPAEVEPARAYAR